MWRTAAGERRRADEKRCRRRKAAFSLVELLVSMAILAVLLLGVVSVINLTSKTWKSSVARAEAFQGAQAAFQSMTRKLSLATLNTYWGYSYPGGDTTVPPMAYIRKSELHFISGPTGFLLAGSGTGLPTQSQSVFFQAPLGYSKTSQPLNGVLNACGFYLEYASDRTERPDFLANHPSLQDRFRYRLMEYLEPSEDFSVYDSISATLSADQRTWFAENVTSSLSTSRPIHSLAENIVALIIQPQQIPANGVASVTLAPDYQYDSRAAIAADPRRNQLPPLVEITMVALDEPSAARLDQLHAAQRGSSRPYPPIADASGNLLGASGTPLFQNAADYTTDLENFEQNLIKLKLNYRIFHSTVAVRGARWSE